MRRLIIILFFIVLGFTATATPIDRQTAQTAATHFMQKKGLIKNTDHLVPYEGQLPATTYNSLYIFNIDTIGFVIVSADDRCLPILGYSMNGSFDLDNAPSNMLAWLNDCATSIQAGIEANAPENKEAWKQWEELLRTTESTTPSPKSDSYLLTSTWEQGSGYNNYCPVMNGQHVVVGCVATAMAQIIRYYGKPTRGFGRKSYRHTAYGILAVDFDTTDYDYSLMPDRIRRSTPSDQKDMVSRLCYHCGIVVNMEYQHSGHTSGSGAHTSNVPEGLTFFGYTDALHYTRSNVNNDSLWAAMIRNEIDNRRPIEYSGFGDDGGHAFVLDGYNDNQQYHFNWGWGGYCDGFYTLTTMVGFTSSHEMVINIYPSGWDGHLSHFHVSPNGEGNGTSWSNANSNLSAAMKLAKLTTRDIWLKEGVYYGDTTAQYAFRLTTTATILAGFAGTETNANQRDPENHPTIFDGQGQRGVLHAEAYSTSNQQLKIYDLTVRNGYSHDGSIVKITGDVMTRRLTIRDCRTDSGSILHENSGRIIAASIYRNQSPTICQLSGGALRQSLVFNNDGDAISMQNTSRVINCDIANNHGTGVIFKHPKNTFVNNIVWNNDVNVRLDTILSDTSLRHCAIEGECPAIDSTSVLLNSDNNHPQGPRFIQPTTERGSQGITQTYDWQLGRGSVCINAGERLSESLSDGDYNQTIRSRQGAVDLGCYESNYPVGIEPTVTNASLSVYPNPTNCLITVSNCNREGVQIFDITGREVLSAKATSTTVRLNVSHLPQGVYFLKSGSNTLKLVKN